MSGAEDVDYSQSHREFKTFCYFTCWPVNVAPSIGEIQKDVVWPDHVFRLE